MSVAAEKEFRANEEEEKGCVWCVSFVVMLCGATSPRGEGRKAAPGATPEATPNQQFRTSTRANLSPHGLHSTPLNSPPTRASPNNDLLSNKSPQIKRKPQAAIAREG